MSYPVGCAFDVGERFPVMKTPTIRYEEPRAREDSNAR